MLAQDDTGAAVPGKCVFDKSRWQPTGTFSWLFVLVRCFLQKTRTGKETAHGIAHLVKGGICHAGASHENEKITGLDLGQKRAQRLPQAALDPVSGDAVAYLSADGETDLHRWRVFRRHQLRGFPLTPTPNFAAGIDQRCVAAARGFARTVDKLEVPVFFQGITTFQSFAFRYTQGPAFCTGPCSAHK